MAEHPDYYVVTKEPERMIADLRGELGDEKLARVRAEGDAGDARAKAAAVHNGNEAWQHERTILHEQIARLVSDNRRLREQLGLPPS